MPNESRVPENLVAIIGGHHIYRDDEYNCFHLFTPGEGWWGFYIKSEDAARRACGAVNPVTPSISLPTGSGDDAN